MKLVSIPERKANRSATRAARLWLAAPRSPQLARQETSFRRLLARVTSSSSAARLRSASRAAQCQHRPLRSVRSAWWAWFARKVARPLRTLLLQRAISRSGIFQQKLCVASVRAIASAVARAANVETIRLGCCATGARLATSAAAGCARLARLHRCRRRLSCLESGLCSASR